MAHLDDISTDLLGAVARDIGELIDRNAKSTAEVAETLEFDIGATEKAAALELAETLSVWKLRPEAFETLSRSRLRGDLADWVEETPFLYHQIKLNGEPGGFARSYRDDPDEKGTLLNVNASPIASRLNQLLKRIEDSEKDDSFFAEDPVVRLLEIPVCRIFALWLFAESIHESRVMVINATASDSEFEREPLLNSDQFFELLVRYWPKRGVA